MLSHRVRVGAAALLMLAMAASAGASGLRAQSAPQQATTTQSVPLVNVRFNCS